jgi:hypothetical protein
VYPQIAQISAETLQFKAFAAKDIQVGKFDWNLIFRWMVPPESQQKNRKKLIDPVRSLTTEVQASLSIEKTKQLCVSIGQKFELSGDSQRDDNHLLPLTTEV